MSEPLDRDRILAADDRRVGRVEVPEWGGYVHVRSLTLAERDRYNAETRRRREAKEPDDAESRFAALVCCDADGRPLFRPEDAAALRDKSAAAVERVGAAALRLNAVDDGAVGDAEKNSGTTPSAEP